MGLEPDLGGKSMLCGDPTQDRDIVLSRRDQMGIGETATTPLRNCRRALSFCLSMMFFQGPVPALRLDAPLPARMMR
jgi:hypothetical protein